MTPIEGRVAPGWEPVREAFAENFSRRGEVGAGVVVHHRGEVVVALHGGTADPLTGRAWTERTPVVGFSTTKGLVATCFLMLEDRGRVDLDTPVQRLWPEFRHPAITVRSILNHRAGLSAIDVPLTLPEVRDAPEKVRDALVRQEPMWEPGTEQGYASCSFGLYAAELFRRIEGRSLGAFLAEEIAGPLGLDTTLGAFGAHAEPPARLLAGGRWELVRHQLPAALSGQTPEGRLYRQILGSRRSDSRRALGNPTLGPTRFDTLNDPDVLGIELPWMSGVTTAAGLSRLYAALAGDGSLDGVRLVRPESLRPLWERQSWSERDRVMHKPLGFSQGFVKEETTLFSPNPESFGHPGAGGALGWADPVAEVAIGYVMNRMDWRIRSPRALALCHAVYRVLGRS